MARVAGRAYAPPKAVTPVRPAYLTRERSDASLPSARRPRHCRPRGPARYRRPRPAHRTRDGPLSPTPSTPIRVKATAENLRALALAGYDVTEGRDLERGTVDVVGYGDDLARFDGRQLSSYRAAPATHGRLAGGAHRRRQRRRVDRLDEVRRGARRRQGAVHRDVRPDPGRLPLDREEARHRHHLRRPRDRRPPDHQGRHRVGHPRAPGGPLQRHAARPRVARGRDLPAHPRLLHAQLREGHQRRSRGHPSGQHDRALVRVREQPRRLRVHVHPRQPAVAQEPARQQRRRRDRCRRRGRPEPQLLRPLGLRRRGQLVGPRFRDLPWTVAGVGAGDHGHGGPLRGDPPGLPEERPHGGGAAALPAGVPAGHADSRPRDLHRARGRPVQAGHPGLPARAVGRPLHHQWRLHRLGLQLAEDTVVHAGRHLRRGSRRDRVRVPRLAPSGGSGVPAPPALRPRSRSLEPAPRRADLAPRQQG